jgi:hypothetical protein
MSTKPPQSLVRTVAVDVSAGPFREKKISDDRFSILRVVNPDLSAHQLIRSSCSGTAGRAGSTNVQLWTPQIKIRVTAAAVSHQSPEGLGTRLRGTLLSIRPQATITRWVSARFRNEIAEFPSNLVPRFVHRKTAESLRNRDQKLVTKSLSPCGRGVE